MKKNVVFLAMVFIASTMLFLTGCQNDETSLQNDITQVDYSQPPYLSKDKQVQKEIQYLIDEGIINKDQLKDLHWFAPETLANGSKLDPMLQGYILKGTDIGLGSRMNIQEDMKLKAESESQVFSKHTKRATMANAGVIKVRMMSLSQGWKTAVIDACAYWNSKGYSVSFSPYSTTSNSAVNGEINVVESYSSNSPYYAATQPPASNGNPGLSMIIYTQYTNPEPIISAKKHAITHELGHALGFGHTDVLETGMSWITSTSIPSVCRTGTDSSSIMKSTMNSYYAFNGFTTCDNAVFDLYYGKSVA